MRVGLIAPPWLCVPPRGYGGTELVVDRLARGLQAAGHEVLLAAPVGSTCPVPLVEGLQPPPSGGSAGEQVISELRHVIRAYEALQDVDVIHDHTTAGPLVPCRPLRIPVVTTNHGTFVCGLGDVYRRVASEVPVIAISRHQASLAGEIPIRRVIHHGIDTDAIPVGDGRGGYAAFLGRMSPDKGAREAVLLARKAGVPVKLAAKMKEDDEVQYFNDCVEPLLGADAEYVGELDAAAKYELLGGAIALLNPIQWAEPFGLVMIEALACGTPVVATTAGSAPELVDDGVTGYTRSDLADLPDALLAAPALSRRSCRDAAATRFSVQAMTDAHVSLYEEVVAEHRGRFRGPLVATARAPRPMTPS
jgi:glycosyltransferase involved in cell wall biosynthesis